MISTVIFFKLFYPSGKMNIHRVGHTVGERDNSFSSNEIWAALKKEEAMRKKEYESYISTFNNGSNKQTNENYKPFKAPRPTNQAVSARPATHPTTPTPVESPARAARRVIRTPTQVMSNKMPCHTSALFVAVVVCSSLFSSYLTVSLLLKGDLPEFCHEMIISKLCFELCFPEIL